MEFVSNTPPEPKPNISIIFPPIFETRSDEHAIDRSEPGMEVSLRPDLASLRDKT